MTAMFNKGLKLNQTDYQFFPNEARSGLYLFWAIIMSPVLIGGPITWIGFELNQYLTDHVLWHQRFEQVLSAPTTRPVLFVFGLLLAILFFVGFPIWGVYLWKLYFLHRKLRQMEKNGLFQYGVYLDETKILIRVFDQDDELVEQHIERSSIQSVKELVTSYRRPSEHITIKTWRLLVTWKEGQKSWYIPIDDQSFNTKNFIALGLALDVEPAESNSMFKD